MNFGQKLRQLKIQKGLTQQKLAEKLGYKTNSYISDVENGRFIPSKEKLKKIAKALGVSFKVLDDMLIESRLEALGIKEPELISLFKDIPNLPEKDKKAIINAYLKIKERKTKKKIMKRIIEKANEIREKYGVDDLELLASKLGAEVVEMSLGRIIKEMYIKDEGVIVIDPNLHPYKKRHLIAHALAHHLFHRKDKVNYFLEGKENGFNEWLMRKHEREAEVFAVYLLIPEDILNELLKQEWVKESPDPVAELAEEFQVSENFMRKRLMFKRYLRV